MWQIEWNNTNPEMSFYPRQCRSSSLAAHVVWCQLRWQKTCIPVWTAWRHQPQELVLWSENIKCPIIQNQIIDQRILQQAICIFRIHINNHPIMITHKKTQDNNLFLHQSLFRLYLERNYFWPVNRAGRPAACSSPGEGTGASSHGLPSVAAPLPPSRL